MIAFATLFLGLVFGPQEVELVVGDEVAAVEVLLNDLLVATLTEPPWKLTCGLGNELEPQELVAVARDEDDREIGRARQWLNLPHPPANVTVALGREGGGRVVHLAWESRAGADPVEIEIRLDGEPLEITDPRRVALPPYDERQLHVLRARLVFPGNVRAVADATFGGSYSDQVSTELTAVPVRARKNRLRAADLEGLLVKKGMPLQVVAVEKGSAQVIVVPDSTSRRALNELSLHHIDFEGYLPLAERVHRLRDWARFRSRQYVRFLWPVTRHQEGTRHHYDLFPGSVEAGETVGGLYFLLYYGGEAPYPGDQRFADAVAVAGLHAVAEGQRRAVVLLLGDDAKASDPSLVTPLQARRFLEHLRVPFQVWSIREDTGAGAWGEARDVSSLKKMQDAVDDLAASLDRQWMVWIDGIHLPQDIALAPAARGLELVR